MKVSALVLSGEGINCERETARAFQRAGGETRILHLRDLCAAPGELLKHHILALPGGFSYGDEIGSGQVLALRLKTALREVWTPFLEQGGLVIGICNGFQALAKMRVFGDLTLVHNRQNHFIDQWEHLTVESTPCFWTNGLAGSQLAMPIRHGEGRLWVSEGTHVNPVLSYLRDVNGSWNNCAGITDETGQILGLMPHPEAALDPRLAPLGTQPTSDLCLQIFRNAINHIQETRP
jgi:phosphoribosylformylglycinamidine (FGAM) synthase-like amidotransferase family enzyme